MGGSSEAEKDRKAGKYPTVESWNDADCKLEVTQPEGWMCKVCNVPPAWKLARRATKRQWAAHQGNVMIKDYTHEAHKGILVTEKLLNCDSDFRLSARPAWGGRYSIIQEALCHSRSRERDSCLLV